MRTFSKFALGASFVLALPTIASAQKQGALEIGGFGRFSAFADTANVEAGVGGGGRAALYLFRNLAVEMDLSYIDTERDFALPAGDPRDTLVDVSHTLWNFRLRYDQPLSDKVKLMIGGGYGYDAFGRARVREVGPRSGGPSGLIGLRFMFNNWLSGRLEAIGNYAGETQYFEETSGVETLVYTAPARFNYGAQAGLSITFFGEDEPPMVDTVTVERIVRDTVYTTRIDTVRVEARPVVIGAVQFAFARDALSDEAKGILDQIAESLTDASNSSRTISVTGNTDAIGSERFNEALGQRRAEEVRDYLVSKGVAASRISVVSKGEADPIAPNNTDNGRATNRRVLIMLSN
jgi:outer membrane protein OmpA-like peptidoglycan-associated protein